MMERWDEGLLAKGTFVKGIAEKTEAKDRNGKGITGSERVAIEKASEGLMVILLAGDDAVNKY